MKYKVNWKKAWGDLAILLGMVLFLILILFVGISFLSPKISFETLLEIISVNGGPLMLIVIIVSIATLSFLGALFERMREVEVLNGNLTGRKSWGLSNIIPISKIRKLYYCSYRSSEKVVAEAKYYGEVHISIYTVRLDELIAHIEDNSAAKYNV